MITPIRGVTKVCPGTRHTGCPTSPSEDRSQVHRDPPPDRRPPLALTNQVPEADAGDIVDVHFDAPAIRATGPDQPRQRRSRLLTAPHSTGMPIGIAPHDGRSTFGRAVRCGAG